MSAWILIMLLLWFVIGMSSKNARRNNGQAQQQPRRGAPVQQANREQRERAQAQRSARPRQARPAAQKHDDVNAGVLKHSIPNMGAEVKPFPPVPGQTLHVHEGEGFIGTQGETAEEHALHIAENHARETAHRKAHAAYDKRRLDRAARLRNAVVMSEVLDRPVSLREEH